MALLPIRRVLICAAMAGVGFAVGAVWFGRSSEAASSGVPGDAGRQLADWSSDQPSGLSGASAGDDGVSADDGFVRTLRAKRDGLGSAIRAHLNLVAEAPLGELPELMIRTELAMPGGDSTSMGELVRVAIIDRMLEEDPDALLAFALSGRSEYLDEERDMLVKRLLDQQGYDVLNRKIAAGEIPAVNVSLTNLLLAEVITDDPARGWELALKNPNADLATLAAETPGTEVIDRLLLGGRPVRLPEEAVRQSFQALADKDPAGALRRLGQLEHAVERLAAIRGIGNGLAPMGLAGAEEFAAELVSDQERLQFYRGMWGMNAPGQNRILFVDSGRSGESLGRIARIQNAHVRGTLMEEELRRWKRTSPDESKAWATENDQLALYDRIEVTNSIQPNAIDALLLQGDAGRFVPPPGVTGEALIIPPITNGGKRR